MTEEVQNLAEVDSAPAPVEATAASQEVVEQTPEQKQESRSFSQEELDAIVSKRLAREQRKWEREQAARLAELETQRSVPKELPPADAFESPEAYAEALAYRKAEELIAQRERQAQQRQYLEAWHEREEEARNKYDDFEQVAYNKSLPISDAMAETIQASDVGPDIAYYLGSNIKEAQRIASLPPYLQAKEIGRIEAKLSLEPLVKKTSSAPAPISPIKARASGVPAYDTTDPRSTKTMSASEWIEAERQRQIRKMQAQNR